MSTLAQTQIPLSSPQASPASLIDTHCHLERGYYGDELDAVLLRAQQAGVSHCIAVGAGNVLVGTQEAIALAEQHAHIFATAGIHPQDAGKTTDADLKALESYARHPKVVAIGEIGLDYHYEDGASKEVQEHVLQSAIATACLVNKPIMLHIRDAHADAFALLDHVAIPQAGGIVHCFTGGPEEAQAYLKRGFYLSIPGVVTFKNAGSLLEAISGIPRDRLLLETDAPYLAPVPYRGKRNEPSYIVKTAEKVATLCGMSYEELARITTENAKRIFSIH